MAERESRPRLSRRDFLGVGAAGALAASGVARGASARSASDDGATRPPANARAKNVILLISDGMSLGTLTLADLFVRERSGKGSRWVDWIRSAGSGGAARALLATDCADSPVTDSAAASSAWSIGERVAMGALNITPDWRAPEPLWLRARRAGKATGLVTTARVTHATPAGFASNVADRELEEEVARQLVDREIDVLLGGGAKRFSPALIERRAGLFVRDREGLVGAAGWRALAERTPNGAVAGRVLGLFTDSHMAYEVERPATQPSLAEMTTAALSVLERAPEGFALHVEGGRVDHGAHSNCPAGLLFDQAAFDEALGVALDWAQGRDPADTLVIATSDHGNANPGLQNYGKDAREKFSRIPRITQSADRMIERVRALPEGQRTGAAVGAILERGAGVMPTKREIEILDRWVRGEAVEVADCRSAVVCPIGSVLANHTGLVFLGPNHTSDMVECTAWGPGSHRIASCAHLTDIRSVVEDAMGLPEMRVEWVDARERKGAAPD